MSRGYRMVPAHQAGYTGPAHADHYVVQRFDAEAKVWFDVGDPQTEAVARERLAALS